MLMDYIMGFSGLLDMIFIRNFLHCYY